MRAYLRQLLLGLLSLLRGLRITGRHILRAPVTELYPHAAPQLSKAYRSAIQLVRFEETRSHDCVACMQCVNICPSFCIAIDGEKLDGIKKQRAVTFHMDFSLCSLCGLCIDACPTETLEYSRLYDVAGYRRDGFMHDLLEPFVDTEAAWREEQRVREEEERERKAAEKAQKKAPKPARTPKASTPEGGVDAGAPSAP